MVAKGLRKGYLWEVSWRLNRTATYWPPVPLSLAALLSRSAGLLDRGFWGTIALCWVLVLSTASYLQLTDSKLTRTSCNTGLYHCLTTTCFLWASHLSTSPQSRLSPDIFDRMHLFLDRQLGQRSICYSKTPANNWYGYDTKLRVNMRLKSWIFFGGSTPLLSFL